MVEAHLIVAAIADCYRIELVLDQNRRPEPLITLHPAPGIRSIPKASATGCLESALAKVSRVRSLDGTNVVRT